MKKILGFAAVVAMVAAANVKMASNNNEELTALQLENIEYLAEAEIYLPYLEHGYRCCYVDFVGRCAYYWGAYSQCPDFACQY